MAERLIRWIAIREAKSFIADNHRHLPHLHGCIVAIGYWLNGQLRGVAVLGRGSRMESKDTIHITRLCTDGARNACSQLYSKAKRLGQAMGFVKVKTFTLLHEPGSSLRAVNAIACGQTKQENWDRPSRKRKAGTKQRKQRWTL